MDEIKHECGVVTLYHAGDGRVSEVWPGKPDELSFKVPRMLQDLQNRGQLSAGFSTFNPDRPQLIDTYRELGPVSEALKLNHAHKHKEIMKTYAGRSVIGHVRYATDGPTTRAYAQPFERRHGCKWKWFTFAFNGNIANVEELRKEVLALNDYHLVRENDTEVLMHLISHALRGDHAPDLITVFTELTQKLDGAYTLAFLNALNEMVILRDPLGLRPLCYASDGPVFAAASESVALLNMGFQNIKSLEPGGLILLRPGQEPLLHRYAPRRNPAHCFFEWIYFANVASVLDDRSVYLSRAKLGEELAELEGQLQMFNIHDGNTVVVPVPDTGKAAADAMAYKLGIPSVEGLIRNRYVGRTFIEPDNRVDKVRQKFTPLREVLEGKRIILVEDSLVRSTTLKTLLSFLRDAAGVKEIHVRIACPPIVGPCYYGINMASRRELYAPKFMKGRVPTLSEQNAMAIDLGADSLIYLPLDSVARCIDLPESHLCRGCLTTEYPTPTGNQRYALDLIPKEETTADHGSETPRGSDLITTG
jgi:amidophosphoribosyltransferase